MKQILPLPMPRTELGEGQVTAESPKTPAAPSPVTPGQRHRPGIFPTRAGRGSSPRRSKKVEKNS